MAFARISSRGKWVGTSLFGFYWCAQQSRVWFLGSWVSNRVYWRFHYLASWTRCLFGLIEASLKSVRVGDKRYLHFSTEEIQFHDGYLKNYSILYAKPNKSGSESRVSSLKQLSEMSDFYLKQGRRLKASAAHLYANFPWVSPRTLPPADTVTDVNIFLLLFLPLFNPNP